MNLPCPIRYPMLDLCYPIDYLVDGLEVFLCPIIRFLPYPIHAHGNKKEKVEGHTGRRRGEAKVHRPCREVLHHTGRPDGGHGLLFRILWP